MDAPLTQTARSLTNGDADLPEVPFLRNIGLVVTYKCQVACPHCIIEAGPHRTEEMSLEDAFDWIRQVATYRNGYVTVLSLTGGEPFYNLPALKAIASYGQASGLFVSAVTNAFWATTQPSATAVLKALPAIKMLSVSTDVYHQQHIPFERVRNAILAARECDLPCIVAVCTENDRDPKYASIVEELREIVQADAILTAITFPAGRALKRLDGRDYQLSDEPPPSACVAGSSPMIFPDGRVIACIGPVIDLTSPHPLLLGSLRNESLNDILDRAESNSVLHAVRIWGPRKLISWLRENGLADSLPDLYIKGSVCNACYSLMSNERTVDSLLQLANDHQFQRKVAYARVYYLHEPLMLALLGIHD